MRKRITYLAAAATAAVAAGGITLALAGTAGASVNLVRGAAGQSVAAVRHAPAMRRAPATRRARRHLVRNAAEVLAAPDGISPTTLITPAVAGYYEFGFAGDFRSLTSVFTPNPDTADATLANGQQLCNNGSGWTAGIGAIEQGATQTVRYGIAQQPFSTDGNACLDGVVPAANQVNLNAQLTGIPATDQLQFSEHTYDVVTHRVTGRRHHRVRHTYVTEKVLFQAEDLTSGTNVWNAVGSFPLGVHPVLNQPGVGDQQPAICSTPLSAGTMVASFSSVLANGRGLANQTAVQVDALPPSASVGELSPDSSLNPTSGSGASSFNIYTVGVLC